MIKIRRGLDLPISGAPRQAIENSPRVRTVAVLGNDYHGMKPTMAVQEGDEVKLGQILFTDKRNPGVHYTSPASGRIATINRGAQRVLQSVVIDVEGDAAESFASYSADKLENLERSHIVEQLVNSGSWVSFRTRPYSKVPAIESETQAIFVTAMDTHPLAADPEVVIKTDPDAFINGLKVIRQLTSGTVYVCQSANAKLPIYEAQNVQYESFSGVHPAGNAGTHIHFLSPVSAAKTVWAIGYQDVMAIGQLFTTGQVSYERVIALAGPQVEDPRLVKIRLGASIEELVAGSLKPGKNRLVSGSLLGGRTASSGPLAFLGRYHNQVSVVEEGGERHFIHYLRPGLDRFSSIPIYLSKLLGRKSFDFNTSTNGSERAMVPIGTYEKIMPLDILPTQLLRALIVGDTEMAQKLGCLELDEEDLALCTFVCPGKYEYGPILRDNLTRIEKEG